MSDFNIQHYLPECAEALAKHLCRDEWKDKCTTLDELQWRMAKWQRYIPESHEIMRVIVLAGAAAHKEATEREAATPPTIP